MTDVSPPIGERVLRREDPRLVRGEGQYVGDLRRPGLLHAAFVLCELGHARITRLSLERARQMPGVVGVFGGHDLPALGRSMPPTFQQPGVNVRMPSPLAVDIVRCAGEAVAVVVAEDRYIAADAAEAVEVEYEPAPTVIDPEEALKAGAPLVHQDVPGNVALDITRGFGDVERAFAGADIVVEERFEIERAAGAAIEPRGVLAEPGGADGIALTVWISTQAPHMARHSIAGMLDLPPEQVRVVTPDVGGGFGPKGRVYAEQIVLSALALHLKRPVSWQATRHEDMLTMHAGRGMVVAARIAARSDGTLLGLRARLVQDCGAYLPTGAIPPQSTAQHMIGPYRLPAYSVEIVGVYTNKVPLTPLRGGGRELGVYVMERMMDHLARRLDMAPHEVRRINALRADEFPFDTHYPSRAGGTVVYDSGDYPGHLDRALTLIGYDGIKRAQPEERRRGVYRGVAVTLFIESTGLDRESARVEVGEDGSVTLTVGSPSNGQSHATTMAQVCAAYLGVPVERIGYVSGDTAAMPEGTGTFGSRMAVMAGNATAGAAREVREKALRAAEELLEVSVRDLEIVEGVVRVRGVPDRGIGLGEVARHMNGSLQATHTFAPERPTTFAGGAHAAVVEVDVETGEVHVRRYVVVHDCGTVLNPTVVEGQIHGGVAHGLGNVLGEMMRYDAEGRLLTGSFHRYVMPLAQTVPHIEIEHRESPSPYNPQGIKGAGEGGTIGALATIAGAVEDALEPMGVKLNMLPLRFGPLIPPTPFSLVGEKGETVPNDLPSPRRGGGAGGEGAT